MARPTEVEIGEQKAPVIQPGHTFASITDKVASIVLRRPVTNGWLLGVAICFLMQLLMTDWRRPFTGIPRRTPNAVLTMKNFATLP